MAGLHIHFRVRIPRSWVRWGMAGSLLLSLAPELATESVTLTTYYPAPKGVYAKLMTTGNSYLARDSGTIGIATILPDSGSKLHVAGQTVLQNNGTILEARDGVSPASGTPRLRIKIESSNLNFYGYDSSEFSFMSVSNSGTRRMNFPVNVGIGNSAPVAPLDIGSGGSQTGIMMVRQPSCGVAQLTHYQAGGAVSPCSPGYFPTIMGGLMTKFRSTVSDRQQIFGDSTTLEVSKDPACPTCPGKILCCPCPSGGCPTMP